jgi:hypothetical protein
MTKYGWDVTVVEGNLAASAVKIGTAMTCADTPELIKIVNAALANR